MAKTYKRISNVDETSNAATNATTTATATTTTTATATATTTGSTCCCPTTDHPKTMPEQIYDKLHALFFISISYVTIKYTDTISIVLTSTDIIRPLLYIAIALITVNAILLSYLSVYIPKIKGIKVDGVNGNVNGSGSGSVNGSVHGSGSSGKSNGELWQVYCPRVIPIMTLNGLLCSIFLVRCFWPVWGFLTPFILGVEAFGLLFVTHFIPWI